MGQVTVTNPATGALVRWITLPMHAAKTVRDLWLALYPNLDVALAPCRPENQSCEF